ncbi:MAG: tryptophan synthase subunit alpha [Bacteroidota bacterium]|nr:tryptophan synthase subunit alpha [Bacteroidota bacterium]
MTRLKNTLTKKDLLNIYFTAGYPNLNDTSRIIEELQASGADMIEIGIPFSDPLADGPVIQQSSKVALENGMTLNLLFEQLKDIRKHVTIPLVLMGYFNPVLQFGVEKFCAKCKEAGIDGVIIPDLPLDEYLERYQSIFEEYELSNILLVSPGTSAERLKKIDEASNSFLYFVSSNSTTGNKNGMQESKENYFHRIKGLNYPVLIGFGIKDRNTFEEACKYANGAIIGTSFINAISGEGLLKEKVNTFISSIKDQAQLTHNSIL